VSEYEKVTDIIFGRWKSQILYAGVKLGVFDIASPEPLSAVEMAKELSVDPALLYRLLRALASIGLLKESAGRRFFYNFYGQIATK
jgi:hypothetical protein